MIAQTPQVQDAGPSEHALLEDQLLRMAYERLPMSLLMTIGVTVVFIGMMWSIAPPLLILTWAGSVVLSTALRYPLCLFYRRAAPGPDAVRLWGRWYLAGVVLAGLAWTGGPVLIVVGDSGQSLSLLAGALLSVCAVAMNSMGSQRVAMQTFVIVVLLPFSLALLFSPSPVGNTLALVVLAGMVSFILVGRSSHRGMRELVQAQADLRALAEEAGAARARAEAASVAKTRFLANMSHELRTPLNAVIGAAQLLRAEEAEPERQAHLVDAIQRSGTNLLGLIENILDLSRIEAGELPLHPLDFHLVECVESALSTAALAAHAKGLKLACVVDPQLDPWRHGDGDRLRQVLLNLLGNAAKFTERGEIVLRVAAGTAAQAVRFTVTDTGVGIGEASLPHVFKPFRQADDAADRRYGGSGLGLAIVQQLAQAMGGSVQVTSTLGVGSCFVVEVVLPLAPHPAAEPAGLAHRVAFVEPHDASAEALLAHLQRLGCEASRCSSGTQLADWLRSAGNSPPPWVLLAADEIDASACIDAVVDLVQPERLIVMSTRVSHEVDHVLEGQHLSRQMVKPITRAALVSRMGAREGLQVADRVPASVLTHAQIDALTHVLVVEDDELNRLIVSGILQHAGCRVSLASGGSEALSALALADRVDLVLMDWQMPDMDGLEVTQRLRAGAAGPAGQTVPIIALTANAFAEDRAACLAAGMNDFLSKPVLAASLVAAVQRWTSRRGDAPAPILAPEVPEVPEVPKVPKVPKVPEPAVPGAAVYDASVLAALPMVADGSAPEYPQQLLAMFLQARAQTLQDLERASVEQDRALLCRLVHTLKSASAAVGALELAELAGHHEQLLRQGLPPAPDLADRLGKAFARLRRAIETPSTASRVPGAVT